MPTNDLHRHIRELSAEFDELAEADRALFRSQDRSARAFRAHLKRSARIEIIAEKIARHIAELTRRQKRR